MATLNPPLTVPFTFTNGTVADATQVNANFSALIGAVNTNVRTILAAATTFYVAPTGSDSTGSGLTPTTPAATIQFILSLIENSYDLNGQTVTIQLSNGAYTQSTLISGLLLGQNAPNNLQITGNMATPSLVTIEGNPCFNVTNGGACQIQGITMTSSISQCIVSQESGNVAITTVSFGNVAFSHLLAVRTGTIKTQGNYTIVAGGTSHAKANGGQIYIEAPPGNYTGFPSGVPTVTLTGTPAFTQAFAICTHTGNLVSLATYSGAATGPRYDVEANGVIETNGAGANYFPGNSAGIIATGGQYL
jgi:hypothetical protein